MIVGVTENLVGTYLIASQLKLTWCCMLIILVLVFKILNGLSDPSCGEYDDEQKLCFFLAREKLAIGSVAGMNVAHGDGSGAVALIAAATVLPFALSNYTVFECTMVMVLRHCRARP